MDGADEQSGYGRLGRFLDDCASLDDGASALLRQGWNTSTTRHVVCMAFCKSALEHAISQRSLIAMGHHGTALALVRLQFEAVVRAAWVMLGAKEKWLQKFVSPVAPGDVDEPNMGPPIPSMLDAIKLSAPDMAQECQKLYATVEVMHSFVHGGVHLVVHALRGYPPDKLVDVLKNRNLLLLMLCNVVAVASGSAGVRCSVEQMARRHASILPQGR